MAAGMLMSCADSVKSTAAGIYFNMGMEAADDGRYEEADKYFSKAVRLNPEITGAYLYRAETRVNLGRFDEAIKDCNRVIARWPKSSDALTVRADAHYYNGEFDRAIADYSQALGIDPDNEWALLSRGAAFAAIKNYDRAVADFGRVIALDPNDAEAYGYRGEAWNRLGEYERALADFERAYGLAGEEPDTANNLAWFLATCEDETYRDIQRAVRLAEKAVAAAPETPAYMDTLAAAYFGDGRLQQALSLQRKAVALAREQSEPGEAMDIMLKNLDKYERAAAGGG